MRRCMLLLHNDKKKVPMWICSQQCLWIILSNQVVISGKRCCSWVFQIFFFFFFKHQKLCAISFYHFWAKADISTADISITWQLTSTACKRKNTRFWSCGELSLLRQVFSSTQSQTNSLQIFSHMIHYVLSRKPTVSHLNLPGSIRQVCVTITSFLRN